MNFQTTFDSLVNNAEKWLLKLLTPLEKHLEFDIKSPQELKEEILKQDLTLDPEKHAVCSFDVTKLFSMVNVPRVVSYITDKIYRNPRSYFKAKDEEGNFYPAPLKQNFQKFLIEVLTKFNVFSCQTGVFRQHNGLAMGGVLAPLLAKIFVSMMEEDIVKRFLSTGQILLWKRYMDDVLCV